MKRSEIKKRPLSDTTLANLEPEHKDFREKDSPQLYFYFSSDGNKSWQLRYKNKEGKWSWMGLGAYPSVGGALARRKANECLNQLAKGLELESKRDVKLKKEQQENLKFVYLINEWLNTKKSGWGEETATKAKKSIYKHIIPVFGERDYTKITPVEWFNFFQNLQRTQKINNQVIKLISYCSNSYDWAKFKAKINYNPLQGISKHLDKFEGGHMKFVDLDELPALIHTIRGYKVRSKAIGLELNILLFPRPGELRWAKWEQFDFDKKIWHRPAEIMKGRVAHVIPLSDQAINLLKELKEYRTESPFLFPGRGSLTKPISQDTFNSILKRNGYRGKQTPHGFRHIASTNLNEQFSDKSQVIEVSLAHKKKGVKGVYDKSTHLDERRVFIQWWADYIDSVME